MRDLTYGSVPLRLYMLLSGKINVVLVYKMRRQEAVLIPTQLGAALLRRRKGTPTHSLHECLERSLWLCTR